MSSCELQAGLWCAACFGAFDCSIAANHARNLKPSCSVNGAKALGLKARHRYIAVADLFQQSPAPPPVQFHITVRMVVMVVAVMALLLLVVVVAVVVRF